MENLLSRNSNVAIVVKAGALLLARRSPETTPNEESGEWPAAWTYSDDKPEVLVDKVVKKVKDAASGQAVAKITLRDNGIYVGKHTVGGREYATAIYSRKREISKIKKVVVSSLDELLADSIKQHLYCENTYIKYLVLAFYEEGETEPSLVVQAAKNALEPFSSQHLEAWMQYLGVMGDTSAQSPKDIVVNVRWISQFSPEINGRKCHWCGSGGTCCNGGTPCATCPNNSTKQCCLTACADSLQNSACDSCTNQTICDARLCKTNNCCFQAALAMIEQFGVTTNRSQAIDIATLISDNRWEKQSDLQVNIAKITEGIDYIDATLKSGKPVLIGIHYENNKKKLYNANKATLHYMVIVGKISKNDKEYYYFYDPELQGKAATNLLKIDRSKSMIHGIYKGIPYTITEVRKNL
jgi:hypothetical protein